ncbi:MAG: shikimate dehydrogenase [Limisphaerales bacterium]
MEKTKANNKSHKNTPIKLYGLIGYPLSHSFSPAYFADKFLKEGILNSSYKLFPLESIEAFTDLIIDHPELKGLNVTIPYKQAVIPYLLELDEAAKAIGAVNTICFTGNGLIGHNTDWLGFRDSIQPLLKPHHKKALVLGTGGSSKAVHYALEQMGIQSASVSRTAAEHVDFTYQDIDPAVLEEYHIIVNTTPLGMTPDRLSRPDIPYHILSEKHLLFDLVYNPEKTVFLIKGEKAGALYKNGLEMLHFQAEQAWAIWNKDKK